MGGSSSVPTQMLGVAGAPIPRAPAGSMRDRLRREYRIDTPTLNRALPKIKKIDDDVTATHFAAMRLELSKRMDIMQRLMHPRSKSDAIFWLPPGEPAGRQPTSATAASWRGGRASDILVAVPAKSGTTWAMHICHQLRVGAKPVDFDCAMDVMPWLECGYACYGQNIDAEQTANPRLIKSHLPFKKLPQGTKRLYIFRSIEDVRWSWFRFVLSIVGLSRRVTLDAYYSEEDRHRHKINSVAALQDLAEWWEHRTDQGVLVLFYDSMQRNPSATTAQIATLMDIPDHNGLYEKVTAQCSHASMSCVRGPTGKDPFAEHNLADVCAELLGLQVEDRELLTSKVRSDGGVSGQGRTSLPRWMLDDIQTAWEEIITARFGFKDLATMVAAREVELDPRRNR